MNSDTPAWRKRLHRLGVQVRQGKRTATSPNATPAPIAKRAKPKCTRDRCTRLVQACGLCALHYTQRRRAALKRAGELGHEGRKLRPLGLGLCSACRETAPVFQWGKKARCRECLRP